MRVLTGAEASALDARTIAAGKPGLLLMERAAAAVAREVEAVLARRPERGARIVVLAGTGNNGGDGFEVARLLAERSGHPPRLVLVGSPEAVRGDARTTFDRFVSSGGAVRRAEEGGLEELFPATLVVDALFGTGLSRPVAPDSLPARALAAAARSRAFVVAVDVPSGVDAGAAAIPGPSLTADLTVTFGHPKIAHALAPAAAVCGRLVVADIGLLPAEPSEGLDAVTAGDVASLFPPRRDALGHKGTFGRVGLLAGSPLMPGAAILAARGAHRAGAGLVTVMAGAEVRAAVHVASPETTTLEPREDLGAFDGFGIGPGLGTDASGQAAFEAALASNVPGVFDADALNLAAGRPERFAGRTAGTVLTPHPGEAARLLGTTVAVVNGDREGAARELARRARAVVVLKGFRSIVADPDGSFRIVLAGNPGMATGGTGDVLTGVVAALLARGLAPSDAAAGGAYLHGLAGDLARESVGEEALVASDVARALGAAFETILRTSPA